MKSPLVRMSYKTTLSLAILFAHIAVARAENFWPGFRGLGASHAVGGGLPLSWEARGRGPSNWSIRLPGYGQSSPVVWNDTLFVTAVSGEQKESLHLLAISRTDGKTLWQKDDEGTQRVKDSDTVSRGAPTPVVDANRVYAVFESGDVLVFTHAGEMVWKYSFTKEYGEIKGPHGYASSPVLVDGLLILQVAHAGPSYILALDAATGAQRWKVDHPSQTGWSSPTVLRRGGVNQVVISTSGSVRSLAAATGQEVWAVTDLRGNSTNSPTVAGDYIVIGASAERGGGPGRGSRTGAPAPAGTPAPPAAESKTPAAPQPPAAVDKPAAAEASTSSEKPANAERPGSPEKPAVAQGSLAIHLGSEGAADTPQVAWRSARVTSSYASPLVVEGLAYFVNRVGAAQCVDVATGSVKWQHRLPGEVWASPVACNGHVLFFCKQGAVVTLKAGPELVEVAESQISATDVIYGVAADDTGWIVRTGRGLVRISAAEEPAPAP